MASVLWVGGRMLADDTLTIGTLVSSVFLLNLVFQPLQELSDLYGQVQSAGAAMEKITTVLDVEAEIHDEPGLGRSAADRRRPASRPRHLRVWQGAGPARDRHPRAGRWVPRARRRVGRRQVDDSEARRSLLRPRRAARSVSTGVDLRELELRAYRRQLGVVLQDPFLFAGTIADNIRFARPEATDADVADVAPSVGIDRIARRFDEGLQHEVREGGAGLSAGERQLISIARALLADPRILILDEATSNIDRPDGDPDRARARPAAARPHVDHHRAPARDRPPRGRDPRDGARPHHASAGGSTSCSPRTGRSDGSRVSCRRSGRDLQAAPVTGSRASSSRERRQLRAGVARR